MMSKFYDEIYDDIFLVEDHKWALFCWEKYRSNSENIPHRLVHLDYHWDSLDYGGNKDLLTKMNLDDMYDHIQEDKYIRLDSFILPAIHRGFIKHIDFYCFQDEEYLLPFDYVSYEAHKSIDDLLKSVGTDEIILDLDMDLFNKDGDGQMYEKGDLWNKNEIIDFITKCKPLIEQAKVVTIARSPDFTGDDEDIEYLTTLVIPMIIEIKKGLKCTQNG